MIKIRTEDGLTTELDLRNEVQARAFLRRLADQPYQDGITSLTGVGQTYNAQGRQSEIQYSLARPVGFREVSFDAEAVVPDQKQKGGERIVVVADEVRVVVMIHKEQNAARITLTKTGRQRFNPRMPR